MDDTCVFIPVVKAGQCTKYSLVNKHWVRHLIPIGQIRTMCRLVWWKTLGDTAISQWTNQGSVPKSLAEITGWDLFPTWPNHPILMTPTYRFIDIVFSWYQVIDSFPLFFYFQIESYQILGFSQYHPIGKNASITEQIYNVDITAEDLQSYPKVIFNRCRMKLTRFVHFLCMYTA